MENKTLNFGSEELKEKLKQISNFAKFEKNKLYKVEILSPEISIRKYVYEGKQTTKYDIKVKINNKEEKTWGVSRTVLNTINQYWDQTKTFNVMLGEISYSVIPILDKE